MQVIREVYVHAFHGCTRADLAACGTIGNHGQRCLLPEGMMPGF